MTFVPPPAPMPIQAVMTADTVAETISATATLEADVSLGSTVTLAIPNLRHGDITPQTAVLTIGGVTIDLTAREFSVDYARMLVVITNTDATGINTWATGEVLTLTWSGLPLEPMVMDHETRIEALEAGGGGGGAAGAIPIQFPFYFVGMPATSAVYTIGTAIAVTIPVNLAGSVVYDRTQCTANAIFMVSRIDHLTGAITTLGSITITRTSHFSCTSTGPGGVLAVGDVLQITAPEQDATLADVGITILGTMPQAGGKI